MGAEKTKEDRRVPINREFSITIPEGMLYSADKNEIGGQRILVFIRKEANDTYLENFGEVPEITVSQPFGAPECLTMMEPHDLANRLGSALDLSDEQTVSRMHQMANNFLSIFGGEVITVKEEDGVLVYYSRGDEANCSFAIITPRNIYPGQIWINDIADVEEAHRVMEAWLSTVQSYTLTEEDKVPSPPFRAPAYTEGRREQMGILTVAVPDGFVTIRGGLREKAPSLGSLSDLLTLQEQFCFLAVPGDFPGGLHHYKDAPFSCSCQHSGIQSNPVLNVIWALPPEDRETQLRQILLNGLSGIDPDGLQYCEPAENVAVSWTLIGESGDPVEYWRSYFVAFFSKDTMMQLMVYINAQKDIAAFDAALRDWILRALPASDEEIAAFRKEALARDLGEYAAEDGKIDAVKVADLFTQDVIFNNDDQISYDGTHHHMTSFQLNSQVMDNYPQIIGHAKAFKDEILHVVQFTEENENLMVPRELFAEELLAVTRQRPITGTSIFDLCAWHLIHIKEPSENQYLVVVGSQLLRGLPECCRLIAEFIGTLRAYNGKTEEFTVSVLSAMVADAPVDCIAQPVKGAAEVQPGNALTVAPGEHPFAGVVTRLTGPENPA